MRFRSSTARHPGHRVDGATSALGDRRLQDDHSRCCWPAARSRRMAAGFGGPLVGGLEIAVCEWVSWFNSETPPQRTRRPHTRTVEADRSWQVAVWLRVLLRRGDMRVRARREAWSASCDGDDRGLARRRPASHASHDCSVRRSILSMLRQAGLRTLSVRAACSWLRCRGARSWVLARSRFNGVGRFRAWSSCVIV